MMQGSQEWFDARLGKATASRVSDVMARTKTGWSASRAAYEMELLCERLTGLSAERFKSSAMQWGTDTEPQARAAYAFMHDADVADVGFVEHPRIDMSGASPDGLVGTDGLIEIKCPLSKTHIETLLSQSVPAEYVTQMQWQMACTERAWCDFVSFDPRLPSDLQMLVARVDRDDEAIAEMEREVEAFLADLDAKVALLTEPTPADYLAAG